MNPTRVVCLLLSLLVIREDGLVFAGQGCEPSVDCNVEKAITSSYLGYRVLELSDLNKEDQSIWRNAYGNACAGVVSGRFSGKKLEQAILLIPANDNVGVIRVIIGRSEGEHVHLKSVFSERRAANLPVLRRGEPGDYVDVNGDTKVHATHDVVLVEHLESSVIAIAIIKDRVKILTISD